VVIRQPQALRLREQLGAKPLHVWPFRFVAGLRAKFIADNPDALARYVAALGETVAYIANREEASAWFGEALRIDPKIVLAVAADDERATGSAPTPAGVELTAEFKQMVVEWAQASFALGMVMCGRRPRVKGFLAFGLRSGASHVSGLFARHTWPLALM
jgi:hypothetical protein